MLVKAGVDISKVRMVDDQTYNPLLLVHGSFAGLQAYLSNEPITLRADHASFTTWARPSSAYRGHSMCRWLTGSSWPPTRRRPPTSCGPSSRRSTIARRTAPPASVTWPKPRASTFDVAHGEAEWRFESALALDHHLAGAGIGVQSLAEWAPEAKAVAQYKLVHVPVDLAVDEDTWLASSLYRGTRLIWPRGRGCRSRLTGVPAGGGVQLAICRRRPKVYLPLEPGKLQSLSIS